MSTGMRRFTQVLAGMLLAVIAGAPPALADDTELMLMMPDAALVKPNILFMLDTSGSMGSEVSTTKPYDPDPDVPYTGDCDANAVYWTDVDVVPSCDSTQKVSKDAFECASAEGPLKGVGSYADTMVQFRPTAGSDVKTWQELQAGNTTDKVECMGDSGQHGEGTAGDVYATNDSDTGFTSDETHQLGWGSAPATVTYTVYRGDYLNWKYSTTEPVLVKKIDILKAVTTAVLNSISHVNVGVMAFNNNDGGVVIQAMSDLDDNRTDILETVNALSPTGNTPLPEVMYEGALYWRGGAPEFGSGHPATDLGALDADGTYNAPEMLQCSKNFNILLSDGQPQDNTPEAPSLVATLPGFPGCSETGAGACLDELAGYLHTTDLDGDDTNGEQTVRTYTIGFALDIQSLEDTAVAGDGQYSRADDVESLTFTLMKIFDDIQKRSLSFTAPAISVNSFNRTQNLNELYVTVFQSEPKVHWPGNLKKYKLAPVNGQMQIVDDEDELAIDGGFFRDTARSIWSDPADGATVTAGGAAHMLPAPDARTLLTNIGGALVDLDTASLGQADLGLTGAAGEPTVDELLDWMHGSDVRNEDHKPDTLVRNAMGDPLHSQPAAVVYGGSQTAPETVVFVGTNDGYLHAIDGKDGHELWAFIPKELLDDMNRLYFDPSSNFKHYGIDGNIVPVVFDKDNDGTIEGGDFVYLVFGLRRGGSSYYALDVTNKTAPELLWVRQVPGQSWSTPVIARVDPSDDTDDANKDPRVRDAVVIVGGGYDPVHDTPAAPTQNDALGAGIYMLDLATGDLLWSAGSSTSAATFKSLKMTRAFPSQIRVLDMSGDGFADRMYAVDIGGRIWRFDITNGNAEVDLATGGIIADLGTPGINEADAPVPRRFYNAPDIAIFNDPVQGRRFISISVGSGYRAHPLNQSANDMFFSVRDPDVFTRVNDYGNYDVITVDDLSTVRLDDETVATVGPEQDGWKFELPSEQAILADSLTFDDSVIFIAFTPEVNASDPCRPTAGGNFAYQVSVVNGDFAVNNLDSPLVEDPDNPVIEVAQGGIAPGAAVLFPTSTNTNCEDAECAEQPIICIGTQCFDPGFANNPVRTLWKQDGIE